MATRNNLADGQVAATAGAIYTHAGEDAVRINVTFTNVGGEAETLVLTVLRNGGTARRVRRLVLDANQECILAGFPMSKTDVLKAATSNAASVDYDVTQAPDNAPLTFTAFDANGAIKSGSAAFSGAITLTDELVAGGGIQLNDDDLLTIGTGDDVTIGWDGTDLDLLAAANNSVAKIGNGTNSFDLWLYGSAAGNYLLWDASANTLQPVAGGIIKPYVALADPGNAGAIPVTVSGYVPIVTAGAETRTLAAPTYIGQTLLIYCKTFVGNGVITCATTLNETGNNTITFTATGQAIKLTAVEEGSNLRWRCPVADPTTILSTV